MKASEVLRAARAKIEKPEAWARDWFAYDHDGHIVNYDANSACKWCIVGALYSCTDEETTADRAKDWLLAVIGDWISIPQWNDAPSTSHTLVLSTLKKAISLAEKNGD